MSPTDQNKIKATSKEHNETCDDASEYTEDKPLDDLSPNNVTKHLELHGKSHPSFCLFTVHYCFPMRCIFVTIVKIEYLKKVFNYCILK